MSVQASKIKISLQSKHTNKFLHFEPVQSLCEDVSNHVLSAHKSGCNQPILDSIPKPKQVKGEVLHLPMVLRVLAYCNGRLIVHSKQRWTRNLITKLPHELAHPQDLLSSLNS